MALVENIKRGRNWSEIVSLLFGPISLLLFVIGIFWGEQTGLLTMLVFAGGFSLVSITAGLSSLDLAGKRSQGERTSVFVSLYIGCLVLVSAYLVWALSFYS